MQLGFIYSILAAITWGLVYVLAEKVLKTISPVFLLFINSLAITIILLPIIFFNQSYIENFKSQINSKNTVLILSAFIFLEIIANFFIFSSIKSLNASTASIIEIIYPFFVVLFAYLIFKVVPNIYFLIGGTLIFIGSFLIIKFS